MSGSSIGGNWARAAAMALALAAGGVAFGLARAPETWTGHISEAAALGAAFAARRSRSASEPERDGLLALAGDFVARHRIDGRVTAVAGEGWSDFVGESDELAGYGLIDRLHEDDRAPVLAQWAAVAADGRVRALAARLARRNGEFARVEVASGPAAQDGGLVSALREYRVGHDLAAELDSAREEARQEKSLKDRLLANMSHELRTPLNAILGFSEILGDPTLAPTDPEKRLEYARIIHTSADHLLSVVNLVLDMSRIEAGKFAVAPEPLELGPLIHECCDMLRLRAERGKVEIVVAPVCEAFEICADKRACRQIVVNLLSNAVKFTPPGGRVVVEAGIEAGVARIAVTDTGIGIKPEDLPRLGDPFFQVKSGYDRSFEGAGLGLSLVRGLVGLHDGVLRLESSFGVGTRVTALLPLAARSPSPGANAPLETISRLTLPALALGAKEEKRIA